jgi:hypothetical protein
VSVPARPPAIVTPLHALPRHLPARRAEIARPRPGGCGSDDIDVVAVASTGGRRRVGARLRASQPDRRMRYIVGSPAGATWRGGWWPPSPATRSVTGPGRAGRSRGARRAPAAGLIDVSDLAGVRFGARGPVCRDQPRRSNQTRAHAAPELPSR